MKIRLISKTGVVRIVAIAVLFSLISQEAFTQELITSTTGVAKEPQKVKLDIQISYNNYQHSNEIKYGRDISFKRVNRWLNGNHAMVNVIVVNSAAENLAIKPAFGSYNINSVRKVKDLVKNENAVAGINASYFKPDTGVPLGTSVVNGEIITGPLYQRVVFGITKDNKFKMAKTDISGEISIAKDVKLPLYNINQPIFSQTGFTVFTDRWGLKTPKTSVYYCHIVVQDNKIQYIKQSSVAVPRGGYVIVGPRSKIPKGVIKQFDEISYSAKLSPEDWNDVNYAVGGGPYLVRDGKIFIDNERFSNSFLWTKAPRTAIGYTKSGNLILVTVDGRQKGSCGATMAELAKIMSDLGAYNAMNLDGGSSTQMVYRGRVVNNPTTKGGNRVTNALVVVPASL